ncbi:MAG: sugar ABC transporter ATP-binding protein [Clostridia bacterium]
MDAPILSVRNIYKSFGSNNVLEDVSVDFYAGEIHALIGVNGAGKSTLVKIMQGVYAANSGDILLKGEKAVFSNPLEAMKKGISMVFQELNLFEELTVTENVMLCQMNRHNQKINWKQCHAQIQQFLDELGIEMQSSVKVKTLPLAQKQLIEIAKCIYHDPKVLFLDEPSSSLSQAEEAILYRLIRELKSKGIAIVLITHKMEEISQLCDTITILRDGHCVANGPAEDYSLEDITHHMLGKSVEIFKKTSIMHGNQKQVVLSVHHLTYKNMVQQASFKLHAGEILAITGLVGSGKSELARTLFGVYKDYSGDIVFQSKSVHPTTPVEAIGLGIGYVPLSRKDEGILNNFSVERNITITVLDKLGFHLNRTMENQIANDMTEQFNVNPRDWTLPITSLSGGNQQKAILSRWIASGKQLILLDDPTRGVDVGAKQEIYDNLRALADQGIGIIIFSSETDELLSSSDRIIIMRLGKMVKELITAHTNAEEILRYSIAANVIRDAG